MMKMDVRKTHPSTVLAIIAALSLASGAITASAVPVDVATLRGGDGMPSMETQTLEMTSGVAGNVAECSLEHGFAYSGPFLAIADAQDAGECCDLCSEQGCGGFAFEADTFACIMFERVDRRDEDPAWTSGVVEDEAEIPEESP